MSTASLVQPSVSCVLGLSSAVCNSPRKSSLSMIANSFSRYMLEETIPDGRKKKSRQPDSCEMDFIYIYTHLYISVPSFLFFRALKEMDNRDTPLQHHLPMQRCLVIPQRS